MSVAQSRKPDAPVLGNQAYLAPEEAATTGPGDIRANIYALGGILCYLLTGQPLLARLPVIKDGSTPPPELPSVERLRPDLPLEVDAVRRRMMAVRPEDRYQTPGEVADALGQATSPVEAGDSGSVLSDSPTPDLPSATQVEAPMALPVALPVPRLTSPVVEGV